MPDTITITDDRTGKTVTVPITDGVFPASAIRELDPNLFIYDPAFMSDRGLQVGDHLPRRRRRHPALPRLPDRAARRALDVPRGRLPAAQRRAAEQGAARAVDATTSPTTRSSTRTCASGSSTASTTTPTRWACSSSALAALGTFYHDAKDIYDEDEPRQADPAADRQDADAGGDVLPLLGRPAVRLPGQRAVVPGQLPQHDVEDRRVRGRPGARAGDGRAVHPPRRSRAELRHHGDARRRLEPRRPVLVGRGRGRRRSTARCTAAPTRPVVRMLTEIGSIDNVPGVHRRRSRAARAG